MVRIRSQLEMKSAHISCSARNGTPPEPTEVLKTTQQVRLLPTTTPTYAIH